MSSIAQEGSWLEFSLQWLDPIKLHDAILGPTQLPQKRSEGESAEDSIQRHRNLHDVEAMNLLLLTTAQLTSIPLLLVVLYRRIDVNAHLLASLARAGRSRTHTGNGLARLRLAILAEQETDLVRHCAPGNLRFLVTQLEHGVLTIVIISILQTVAMSLDVATTTMTPLAIVLIPGVLLHLLSLHHLLRLTQGFAWASYFHSLSPLRNGLE